MTLLTLLNAPTLATYTEAGFWGNETIYHLAARRAAPLPGRLPSPTGIAA